MRKITRMSRRGGILICCLTAILSACTKLDTSFLLDDEVHLKVKTRTEESEQLTYPLYLYAFDTEGCLAASVLYESSEEYAQDLILSSGNYRIVALTGIGECEMPDEITSSSLLTLPEENCLMQSTIMMGSASVTITDADATANLFLSHRMARVELSLSGIPESTKTVKVSFSSLPDGMNFEGDYSDSEKETTLLCEQSESDKQTWIAPTCYIFPNQGNVLTLSIVLTGENGSSTYGYTLDKKIEPGVPYVLSGNYMNGFVVNGNLAIEGWKPTETIRFTFGNAAETEDAEVEDSGIENFIVETMPPACSIWNNHVVVAWQDATSQSADLLLLSLNEWTDVSSANGNQPMQAANIAEEYQEYGLIGGWRIPTKEEAKLITESCGSETLLEKMNSLMSLSGGTSLTSSLLEDAKGNLVRYLCNDAMNSYVVGKSGKQSSTGKNRTYSLRLVKTVHVTMEEEE